MTTDEQAVLQIINTYTDQGKSWSITIEELCRLTALEKDELMQTMDTLKREGYVEVGFNESALRIKITHSGYEAALDAPQF